MHARPYYKEAHNLADTSADPSREMHTICRNALGRSDRREQGQKALHTRFFAMRICQYWPSRRGSAENALFEGALSGVPLDCRVRALLLLSPSGARAEQENMREMGIAGVTGEASNGPIFEGPLNADMHAHLWRAA